MSDDKWRLREVYDLDTKELIVDEVAIARAVGGQRHGNEPWLTRTEAIRAMEVMHTRGLGSGVIAEHIGCEVRTIERWEAGDYTEPMAVKPPRKEYEETPDQVARRRERNRINSKLRRDQLRAVVLAG